MREPEGIAGGGDGALRRAYGESARISVHAGPCRRAGSGLVDRAAAAMNACPNLILAGLLTATLATGASGLAQETRSASRGAVGGMVVDAKTGATLDGVIVTLEPLPGGLVLAATRGGLTASRTTLTRDGGDYRFDDIAPGTYRLRVERLGYRAATVEVAVRQPMDARVSVGLDLAPVVLEPLLVEEDAAPAFVRVRGVSGEPAAARAALERERQTLFLTPDSRALTYADVVESITLGETDVFRALQRFPGVATRDDYTAELWTRGAPWAQTRVTFDDLPLFNPVHAVGVFSGITPEILGAVFFHPGVRSASMGEGAAGAVDLRSRAGGGNGEVRGAVDVSMASARLSLDQRPGDGFAWILSARRSYLDVFSDGLDLFNLGDVDLPFAFHDIAGRVDVRLSTRHTLEASGLWEDDRLFGDVSGVLEETAASWGNAAARVTLQSPLAGATARHTLGVSRYRALIREAEDLQPDREDPWVEPASDNRILHVRLATEVAPEPRGAEPPAWRAGYEVVVQNARYDGPEPRFHPVRPDTTVRLMGEGRIWTAALWAERRWTIRDRLAIAPGLRVEGGTRVMNGGSIRLAPRLAMRLALSPSTSIAAAAGRSWQTLQALALAGPSAHPAFHASQFWLWAGDDAPAIRADVFTLGAEQWLGTGWIASANLFHRRATGVALPDPRPGPLANRPLFVTGENRARGFELGLRRMGACWTTGLGYTLGYSNMDAAELSFPATTDRRHRIDATAAVRLTDGLRLGAAYVAMTGAPYTRVQSRIRPGDCSLFGFGCSPQEAHVEAPNARRTPDYRSLDTSLTLTRAFGGFELSAYLQVRNVLDRDNASTYSGSVIVPARRDGGTTRISWLDRFESGLRRMPLLGARVSF
ncbi:MAG: TonB-dependent receptor [Gemmatimonadetes bacterium]|nr:TonB-dependent receptor [Gemmatimonadota bacterium]